MKRLLMLYPRGWRDRYGEEFAALLGRRSGQHRRLWTVWDIVRGAADAHILGRYGVRRHLLDPAVRRGALDGLIVAALVAVEVVLTNVVFPGGPNESDSDPEYLIGYLVVLACLAGLLIAIGVRGRRRGDGLKGGLKAGAVAGTVIAAMVTVTFLAVNNLFLGVVSQQHDKRVAFAASGWSSMRAYLTVTQLGGAAILIPLLAVIGGALGLLGAAMFPRPDHPKNHARSRI